jgi:hypothetical protein
MPEVAAVRIDTRHPSWRITARRPHPVVRMFENVGQRNDPESEAPAPESVPDEVAG